jgi:hypothetical protein
VVTLGTLCLVADKLAGCRLDVPEVIQVGFFGNPSGSSCLRGLDSDSFMVCFLWKIVNYEFAYRSSN